MKNEILAQKPNVEQAKQLFNDFLVADTSLHQCHEKSKEQIVEITKAMKIYVDSEIENILKGIDIKEINRGEFSVRVANLKRAGYTNFHKIYKLQDYSKLSKINGISLNTAYNIRKLVYEDVQKIKETIIPRLNPDNKTTYSNNLVKALFIYQQSQPFFQKAKDLNANFHENIQNNLQELKPLLSGAKWFFSSKQSKMSAINAYLNLQETTFQNYLIDARFILDSLEHIRDEKMKAIWQDFQINSANYYAVLEQLEGLNLKNITSKNGLSQSLIDEVNNLMPDFTGLKCTLRSYQEFGTKYILNQGYALLGDEMGLGKTIQAIASMVAIRNFGENRFLVVCPASVLINWCREINRHSDLQVHKLHGDYRDFALAEWIKFGGVGVTTYETLDKLDFTDVFNISLLVADEAHYVKNPKANRTINLANVCEKAERVLFMTGTALENHIREMRYLISLLNPEVIKDIQDIEHLSQAQIFREKVAPVYLRRTREDVLQELPDLIESDEWCEMNEYEKSSYYDSVNNENFMAMRQLSWDVADISKSGKAKRLVELCDEAKDEKRKIIVFSFFLKTIDKVKILLKDRCYGPINGSVEPADRQKIIDEFNNAKAGSVLLAQVQAGGTGVNIQSASCVILCEPQLKPSTENQAISRTYRMGQTRNVQVFRLLCTNSIDEKIVDILNTKQTVFEHFANTSVVGKQSIEIDKQTTKKIIESEVKRVAQLKSNH